MHYHDYLPPDSTCGPINDAPLPMLVVSLLEYGEKVRTETTNVRDEYDDNVFNFISLGLPNMYSVIRSNPKTNTTPPTPAKLLAEQAKDTFCRQISSNVEMPIWCYSYDRQWILVRTTSLDGVVQSAVQSSLCPRLLCFFHSPKMAGHPSERRICDIMKCELYWPEVANDAYKTVQDRWDWQETSLGSTENAT